MNPLYEMIMGRGVAQNTPAPSFYAGMGAQNPMQRAMLIQQAMQNPAAFVSRAFPDIPEGIRHDPNQILNYLQQSRGISDQQIQQIRNMIPRM